MTTVKRSTDLTSYASVLPYASELFGVYQPLLGWKSKRLAQRFQSGFEQDRRQLLSRLTREFAPRVDITYGEDGQPAIRIEPGRTAAGKLRSYDNVVMTELATRLPPYDEYRPEVWEQVINPNILDAILKGKVVEYYTGLFGALRRGEDPIFSPTIGAAPARSATPAGSAERKVAAFEHQLQYESTVAGTLLLLRERKDHRALETLFYSAPDRSEEAETVARMLQADDSATAYLSLENLDPRDHEQLAGVVLSPISVVHLFRQYFFELDTFLGPPEGHVWLSPGSSVELMEIHTRRSTVERTLERALETIQSAETTTTEQEELSEAVKEDNDQNIKFGASVTASYASIEATSSFDYGNSQKMARETAHKRMRQQTEKLSSEIRRNFKSTFKTVTEFTDLSSTKHTLANTGTELVNYELRKKMRQVGVQVQDVGTYLCWQTYVDGPGRDLGLGRLIHIASPADLDGLPHPEELPLLQPFTDEKLITIPFISVEGGADSEGEVYVDGVEQDNSEWFGELEKIQADFAQEVTCPRAGYELTYVECDPMGSALALSRRGPISNGNGKATFTVHLDTVDFRGQNTIQAKLILHWSPTAAANDAIVQKNQANVGSFKEAERAAYEKAYVETVKERVTAASKITSRNGDELREEERVVVYRALIQDMLTKGVPMPDDRTRHAVAEILNTIFDVDKMLYFVAPEWWRPRLHRGRQHLPEKPGGGVPPRPPIGPRADIVLVKGVLKKIDFASLNAGASPLAASTFGWGGTDDPARDNYYITEESEPARLGSSLGWLLQLDGDNMRNAFLNAPWVKAIIPIRPGKEQAAINWLKGVEGMNGITDNVIYHASDPDERDINGNPLDGQKMIDVLFDLARKIRKKHEEGIESGQYPQPAEVSDPALVDADSVVTATPIDRVYEHGFYPLAGGFRANVGKNYEIFDQWVEILPTDQSVPVPVAYNPATGRQV
jgi:hypothetical protein